MGKEIQERKELEVFKCRMNVYINMNTYSRPIDFSACFSRLVKAHSPRNEFSFIGKIVNL